MRTQIAFLMFAAAASAVVLDRVAVVVGTDVITESEIDEEIRVTAFLNREPVDLSPASRRAAAERLVDQALIRREMKISGYAMPSAADAEKMLRTFRQQHYGSPVQFERELKKYGITAAQLQQHLAWQAAALHFTDVRFQPGIPVPPPLPAANSAGAVPPVPPVQAASRGRADRAITQQQTAQGVEAKPPAPATVDQQMDAWLKQARASTRIQYKPEAFQ